VLVIGDVVRVRDSLADASGERGIDEVTYGRNR
jgi:hypothetical protein